MKEDDGVCSICVRVCSCIRPNLLAFFPRLSLERMRTKEMLLLCFCSVLSLGVGGEGVRLPAPWCRSLAMYLCGTLFVWKPVGAAGSYAWNRSSRGMSRESKIFVRLYFTLSFLIGKASMVRFTLFFFADRMSVSQKRCMCGAQCVDLCTAFLLPSMPLICAIRLFLPLLCSDMLFLPFRTKGGIRGSCITQENAAASTSTAEDRIKFSLSSCRSSLLHSLFLCFHFTPSFCLPSHRQPILSQSGFC